MTTGHCPVPTRHALMTDQRLGQPSGSPLPIAGTHSQDELIFINPNANDPLAPLQTE